MTLVRIRNLRKTYDTGESRVTPLDGVSLDVAEGDFVSLMGPSGSGKTTLMNIIAGIDRQTAGTVTVGDVELNKLSDAQLARWRNRNIGYVFQQFNLVPVLRAVENVELPLMLLPLSARRRRKQAEIALSAVGLSERARHFPRQMSGGEQQRVAIARAIVTDPKIIVGDEPTGNLDAKNGAEVMELLTALNERFGKTLIIVTHDPGVAARAKRPIELHKGVLRAQGSEPLPAGETV
jgi:putative ABC transport system ATP-binding protein